VISAEGAVLRLTCSVFQSVSQRVDVGRIFCALAEAFDCVNHEIVLAKLYSYGIQGVSEDWYKSSLTNIRQKVYVNSPSATQSIFFDWSTLKHDVP
jgi:hypothetical protein